LIAIGGTAHDTIGNIEKISHDCLRVFVSPQFSPGMAHPIDRSAGLNTARSSASKCRKFLSSAR
jgi:hypothetical protein